MSERAVSPEKVRRLRERVQEILAERRKERRLVPPDPPPRYDSVFYEGVRWLDENG